MTDIERMVVSSNPAKTNLMGMLSIKLSSLQDNHLTRSPFEVTPRAGGQRKNTDPHYQWISVNISEFSLFELSVNVSWFSLNSILSLNRIWGIKRINFFTESHLPSLQLSTPTQSHQQPSKDLILFLSYLQKQPSFLEPQVCDSPPSSPRWLPCPASPSLVPLSPSLRTVRLLVLPMTALTALLAWLIHLLFFISDISLLTSL